MIPVVKKPDGTYACGPEEDRELEVGELYVEVEWRRVIHEVPAEHQVDAEREMGKVVKRPSGKQEAVGEAVGGVVEETEEEISEIDLEVTPADLEALGRNLKPLWPEHLRKGKCSKCGRKLKTIPLLTGFTDVCPECDK